MRWLKHWHTCFTSLNFSLKLTTVYMISDSGYCNRIQIIPKKRFISQCPFCCKSSVWHPSTPRHAQIDLLIQHSSWLHIQFFSKYHCPLLIVLIFGWSRLPLLGFGSIAAVFLKVNFVFGYQRFEGRHSVPLYPQFDHMGLRHVMYRQTAPHLRYRESFVLVWPSHIASRRRSPLW
jgi:hypothetical protein